MPGLLQEPVKDPEDEEDQDEQGADHHFPLNSACLSRSFYLGKLSVSGCRVSNGAAATEAERWWCLADCTRNIRGHSPLDIRVFVCLYAPVEKDAENAAHLEDSSHTIPQTKDAVNKEVKSVSTDVIPGHAKCPS